MLKKIVDLCVLYDKTVLHFVFIEWNLVMVEVGVIWVTGCFTS